MDVVAVVSRKGGVGKTTTAVGLAAALAQAGQRVLLLDLDPQGSCSRALGLEAHGAGAEAGFRKERWDIQRPPFAALAQLGVVAADARLEDDEAALHQRPERAERLVAALTAESGSFGIAVLDTPPGPAALAAAALSAATAVVVPAACDYLAIDALQPTLAAVRAGERRRNRRYTPLALLPTFAEPRRPHAAAALALLGERFGELLLNAVVPRSARFASAALQGVPVAVASPRSAAAEAYRAAAVDLLARLYGRGKPSRRPVKAFLGSDVRAALCERS